MAVASREGSVGRTRERQGCPGAVCGQAAGRCGAGEKAKIMSWGVEK